jgi:hypothetical protein
MFFDYSLRLDKEMLSPIVAGVDGVPFEINIWAWEAVRYKYKFYKANQEDVSDLSFNILDRRLK